MSLNNRATLQGKRAGALDGENLCKSPGCDGSVQQQQATDSSTGFSILGLLESAPQSHQGSRDGCRPWATGKELRVQSADRLPPSLPTKAANPKKRTMPLGEI